MTSDFILTSSLKRTSRVQNQVIMTSLKKAQNHLWFRQHLLVTFWFNLLRKPSSYSRLQNIVTSNPKWQFAASLFLYTKAVFTEIIIFFHIDNYRNINWMRCCLFYSIPLCLCFWMGSHFLVLAFTLFDLQ